MYNKLLTISRYFLKKTTLKQHQHQFLDLIKAPTSSIYQLTKEQKIIINNEIDRKMQELEDTGLSKQQILLSNAKKGLPLKIDPFFQFLKNNKLARQVYIKSNERFTVQKVIDIALRQDIGPDPSYSRIDLSQSTFSTLRSQFLENIPQTTQKVFDTKNYYSNKQFTIQKAYQQLKPNQLIRHIYKPIDRYQRILKNRRRLKKYDIHWRNLQLLRQFVTVNGNIKSQMVNGVSVQDQKKIVRAIKTARHMNAMPHYGRTPIPLRRNITTLQDQVQQIGYQHIDLEYGHIYFNRRNSFDSIEVENNNQNNPDQRYQKMLGQGKYYKMWVDSLQNQPDQKLIHAQKYARYLKSQQLKLKMDKNQLNKKKISNLPLKTETRLDQPDKFIPPVEKSNESICEQTFKSRKKQFIQQFNKNPFILSDILLKQKIDL